MSRRENVGVAGLARHPRAQSFKLQVSGDIGAAVILSLNSTTWPSSLQDDILFSSSSIKAAFLTASPIISTSKSPLVFHNLRTYTMGVSTNSPAPPKPASVDINAAKAKAITALKASEASSPVSKTSSPGADDEGERDLAEELNAQTRAKYKKGLLKSSACASLDTDTYRQAPW